MPPVKPVPSAANAIAWVVERAVVADPVAQRERLAVEGRVAALALASRARASAATPRSTGALISRVPNFASAVAGVATER